MFKRTTAINKILALKRRIKIIQGGTSAGKTFGILPILIDKALRKSGLEISVVAESIPHLKRGAMKDFIKIMQWTGRFNENQFNKSDRVYRFNNGSYIEFFSADDSSKLRGARRDILYINECNNVAFESYNELAIRTNEHVYLDFNPTNEFWVHKELKEEGDADFIILTYLDNEALHSGIVEQIEKNREKAATSAYWANWWKVYGEGQIGMLQGVVFDNWEIVPQLPKEAKLLGYGKDFGYTNDPTTMVLIYEHNGKKIWHEGIYQTGLLNSDIYRLAKDLVKATDVGFADSADPKTIAELQRMGLRGLRPAEKGKDSILYGIQKMQQDPFLVTAESTNIIKELRAYTWATDREGNSLNTPIDHHNHAIDAARYFYLSQQKNRAKYLFA